jgi:hypothetical protein
VCWVSGASLTFAVAAASWAAAGIVIATEVLIGLRAKLEGRDLVRQTLVGVVLGLMIVGLRVLLH